MLPCGDPPTSLWRIPPSRKTWERFRTSWRDSLERCLGFPMDSRFKFMLYASPKNKSKQLLLFLLTLHWFVKDHFCGFYGSFSGPNLVWQETEPQRKATFISLEPTRLLMKKNKIITFPIRIFSTHTFLVFLCSVLPYIRTHTHTHIDRISYSSLMPAVFSSLVTVMNAEHGTH